MALTLYLLRTFAEPNTDCLVMDENFGTIRSFADPYVRYGGKFRYDGSNYYLGHRTTSSYAPGYLWKWPVEEPIVPGNQILTDAHGMAGLTDDADYLYGTFQTASHVCWMRKFSKADFSYTEVSTPGNYWHWRICQYGNYIYTSCPVGNILKVLHRWNKSDLSLDGTATWPNSPDGLATDGTYIYAGINNASKRINRVDPATLQIIDYVDVAEFPDDGYGGYIDQFVYSGGFLFGQWVKWDASYQEHYFLFKFNVQTMTMDTVTAETGVYGMSLTVYPENAPAEVEQPGTSFEDSRDELEGRGYLTIYIDRLTESIKVFESINEAIGSYLYSGYDGKYRYRVFVQKSAEGLMQFTDDEIFSYRERIASEELFSFFRTEYAYRREQDYPQVYLEERKSVQYLAGSPIQINREVRVPFTQREDAQYYTQRAAVMYGQRLLLATVEVAPKAWTLEPADFIQMTYTRGGINAVFEVLEVERDMNRGIVTLTLGNQHGLSGGPGAGDPGGGSTDPGIWMAESPAFPGSLGGGSMEFWDKNWSAEQKAYARQNAGFWCEETGFADATDPEAKDPSTWT